MSTSPKKVGSGAANAPGHDWRKTDSTIVEELTDSFDDDLHEDNHAGQHGGNHVTRTYSAYDIKELHEKLSEFDNGELKRIPILAHGERLKQGATYLDLNDSKHEPFTAQGSTESQDPHRYVPKSETDYELWNRMIGRDVVAERTPADDGVPAA